jgi:SAM-dependent methyltransferase
VKARLYYVAEWLDQNIGLDGKTVLDIGAGNGRFLDFVRSRGAHPVGLEPDPDNARKIRALDIACFTGSTETVPTPGQYDLVTINWTLENCGDCLGMLRYAKGCLAPGGVVSVATGSRILVPFKKPLSSYFGTQEADLHCFRWSRNSLSEAFSKVHMGTIRINDYDQRDEMIQVADASSLGRWPLDDSVLVHNFFARWEATWP